MLAAEAQGAEQVTQLQLAELHATSKRAFGKDNARAIPAAPQLRGSLARQGKSTELHMVQAIFHHTGIQPHKDEESESSGDDGGGAAGRSAGAYRAGSLRSSL